MDSEWVGVTKSDVALYKATEAPAMLGPADWTVGWCGEQGSRLPCSTKLYVTPALRDHHSIRLSVWCLVAATNPSGCMRSLPTQLTKPSASSPPLRAGPASHRHRGTGAAHAGGGCEHNSGGRGPRWGIEGVGRQSGRRQGGRGGGMHAYS